MKSKKHVKVILIAFLVYGTLNGFVNWPYHWVLKTEGYTTSNITAIGLSMSVGMITGNFLPLLSKWKRIPKRLARGLESLLWPWPCGILVVVTAGYLFIMNSQPSWSLEGIVALRFMHGLANLITINMLDELHTMATWEENRHHGNAVPKQARVIAHRNLWFYWLNFGAVVVSTLLLWLKCPPYIWWSVGVLIAVSITVIAVQIPRFLEQPLKPNQQVQIGHHTIQKTERPRRFLTISGILLSPATITDSVYLTFLPLYNQWYGVIVIVLIGSRIGITVGTKIGNRIDFAFYRLALFGGYGVFVVSGLLLWSSNNNLIIATSMVLVFAATITVTNILNAWTPAVLADKDLPLVVRLPKTVSQIVNLAVIAALGWISAQFGTRYLWLALSLVPLPCACVLLGTREFRPPKGTMSITLSIVSLLRFRLCWALNIINACLQLRIKKNLMIVALRLSLRLKFTPLDRLPAWMQFQAARRITH